MYGYLINRISVCVSSMASYEFHHDEAIKTFQGKCICGFHRVVVAILMADLYKTARFIFLPHHKNGISYYGQNFP